MNGEGGELAAGIASLALVTAPVAGLLSSLVVCDLLPAADPFWQFLRQQKGGLLNSDVKWNFTKFTVGRDGQVAKRYGSTTSPADMEADIQALLKA